MELVILIILLQILLPLRRLPPLDLDSPALLELDHFHRLAALLLPVLVAAGPLPGQPELPPSAAHPPFALRVDPQGLLDLWPPLQLEICRPADCSRDCLLHPDVVHNALQVESCLMEVSS